MKEIDPVVLWWVALEFLGPWLWLVVALAVLWLTLMVMALCRGGAAVRPSPRALLLFGGAAALLAAIFLPALTDSAWARINGSADWIALALAALAVGIAATALAYPLWQLATHRRR
jgi:hypothetical protein